MLSLVDQTDDHCSPISASLHVLSLDIWVACGSQFPSPATHTSVRSPTQHGDSCPEKACSTGHRRRGHVLRLIIKHISDITYVHGCLHVSKPDRPREDKPPMSQQDLLIVATGLEIIFHSAALEIDSLDCGRESGKLCHLNCPLLSLAVGGREDRTAWGPRLHVCAL